MGDGGVTRPFLFFPSAGTPVLHKTPSAAIEADPQEVLPLIAGLGLFENRFKGVMSISFVTSGRAPTLRLMSPFVCVDCVPAAATKRVFLAFDPRGRLLISHARVSSSERFLEMDEFDCGLDKETKIYGVGEFGVDSFRIFCRGEGTKMNPSDKALRAFTDWLKRTAPAPDSTDGGSGISSDIDIALLDAVMA